ncbi:MAG: DNA translocase FtsK 4TM domain-containing protein, partial [Actinobacteria bacterium]|nr:DNA translocase FtsK 4TM domain-containing protein [Actinomycetota bacterium]
MATKQKTASRRSPATPRKSSSGRSRSSARDAATRSGAAATSRSTRSRSTESGPGPIASLLEGHGHDVIGLVLVVVGVVAAIGIYAGAAGPLGTALAALASSLFGHLDLLVPPALVAGGVLVIVGPRHRHVDLTEDSGVDVEDPDRVGAPAAPEHVRLRRVLGSVLGVLALGGLLHVVGGQGRSIESGGLGAYSDAGGLLGAGVAGAFERVVGRWGALAVLVVLAVLAASLLSGRSLRTLGRDVTAALGPLARRLVEWLSGLFRLGPSPAEGEGTGIDDGVAVALYDQDAGGAPKPKRSRAK